MKVFESLGSKRKSGRTSTGSSGSSPINSLRNSNPAAPPKCVIKALSDYHSSSPVELSFKKGDFFHVIKDDNDTWFEVEDPVKNMKGMVPVKFFEVIGRTHRVSTDDIDSQIKSLSIGDAPSNSSKSNGRKPQPLYAVVQYDFDAERKDELTAKVGDPIIVVARSNEEWFLAKPIGRLGGPGLIPVSYVQIRDPTTGLVVNDIEEAIKKHNIPHIEEWKKTNQQYTENIIPLGVVSEGGANSKASPSNSPRPSKDSSRTSRSSRKSSTPSVDHSSPVLSVAVPSYERRDSFKYLFVVHATRSDHSRQILYRTYDEFYDLQLTLLSQFPKESGRTGEPRIIPFMPGLVEDVTEAVTAQRRIDLDAYLKDLIKLPSHISESAPVLDFFRIRTGDKIRQVSSASGTSNPRTSSTPSTPVPNRPTSSQSNVSKSIAGTVISTNSNSGLTLKIKIVYNTEMIAIRCNPDTLTYKSLVNKIAEKLFDNDTSRPIRILYREADDFTRIDSDTTLKQCISGVGPKMVIYVQ